MKTNIFVWLFLFTQSLLSSITLSLIGDLTVSSNISHEMVDMQLVNYFLTMQLHSKECNVFPLFGISSYL